MMPSLHFLLRNMVKILGRGKERKSVCVSERERERLTDRYRKREREKESFSKKERVKD